MNVHNLMEELVYAEVNGLFDAAKRNGADWLTCDCAQCRLDVVCYVLNRVSPRYIVSGRGLAHAETGVTLEKGQLSADVSRIGLEGMRRVLATQRPHGGASGLPETPVFNLPTIVGRVLDGLTFEPVKDVEVFLLRDGVPAEPIDPSWANPYRISPQTPGTFTFWVKPVKAEREGEKRVFPFEIRVSLAGHDPLSHFFEIGSSSESVIRTAYTADHSFFLPDLHIFPAEPEGSMDD